MHKTTEIALNYLANPPYFVIDFGAGTGQDTIPLLRKNDYSVVAIDVNETALETLKLHLSVEELQRFECYIGAFIEFKPNQQADLLIASFTWPYRPPEQFAACWEKTIEVVKAGGLIAGHFFGPTKNPDPGMTYHTQEELDKLLGKEFKILWFEKEPEGSERKIFGGKEPSWGDLFQVVARKNVS